MPVHKVSASYGGSRGSDGWDCPGSSLYETNKVSLFRKVRSILTWVSMRRVRCGHRCPTFTDQIICYVTKHVAGNFYDFCNVHKLLMLVVSNQLHNHYEK